jgi:hypothetical protein
MPMNEETEEESDQEMEDDEDFDYEDRDDFADPGGRSALRAETEDNPQESAVPQLRGREPADPGGQGSRVPV